MLLTLLTLFATWLVIRSNQLHARIPTCRYPDLGSLTQAIEGLVAAYMGCAICCVFIRPWGLISAGWILTFAAICKVRSLAS